MEVEPGPHDRRPFTERINSKWTRFGAAPKPHGQPWTMRFRECSVEFVSEHHFIGGEATRHVDHSNELAGQELEVAHPLHGGGSAAVLVRTKSACYDAIRQILAEVLAPALPENIAEYHAATDHHDVQFWDEFVPAELVENIAEYYHAEGGRHSYDFDVWLHVEVTRVYSQAEELLRLCEAAAMAPSSSFFSAPPRKPGAGDACAICMGELVERGVTVLPDCSHAFHRECILEWFGKAATCPCCRRDMVATSIEDSVDT